MIQNENYLDFTNVKHIKIGKEICYHIILLIIIKLIFFLIKYI